MPHKEIEADDPMELVGVVLPADEEAMREMAYVFAEEFARMGHDRRQILGLFKNPFYAGAHGAYKALGEEAILAIVEECVGAWGKMKIAVSDQPATDSELKAEKLKARSWMGKEW
jgi:hypothetical protein